MDVLQASKPELRVMRYELTDYEWVAIKSMLPHKPRAADATNCRGNSGWAAAGEDDAGGVSGAAFGLLGRAKPTRRRSTCD